MPFSNLFSSRLFGGRTESVHDYVGVLVSLEEAHLHSYSARIGRCEFEEAPRDEESEALVDGVEEGGGGGGGKDADDGVEGEGMLQMSAAEYTIQGLRREVRKGDQGRAGSEYELKSKLINKAIQDIGMGKYNWQLFVLCGFGWFADKYTTSSLYVGLCIGSFAWGLGADILGRRVAFNMTLLITSVFGIWAAYASSWGWTCFLFACMGSGVGGNLPVDGALFLEFLPDASSALLTLLSVWWPIGQLASSLAAWYFITTRPVEQGWRYFVLCIGVVTFIMFLIRFFIFHLLESPKYLLSQGRQAEAVAVVHGIAYRNGTKTWLTEEVLDAVADGDTLGQPTTRLSTRSIIQQNFSAFSGEHLRPLFSSRKLGTATGLVWFCWATIGMGYPLFNAFLPQYLSHGGSTPPDSGTAVSSADTATTYRNYAIISMVGVPGSLLAAYTVDHKSPYLGRKGTLAISTFVSAIFLFLFVAFGTTLNSQLFFTCVEAFTQNIMYGVLYAFTPEIFPAPVRGAGTGVASFLNRITGLVAPVLAALLPGDGTKLPIYLSGILIFAAFGGSTFTK
ncbi:hypothetical protein TruAng_003919 [Truncatella angustata]|nr:hypothetical protein TruAng_003919 [Truncatella angustata]